MNILEQNMKTISEQNMMGGPPKFSQYDADKIISDILNYKYTSYNEIAKDYKCNHLTVRNLLNRNRSRQLTQHYSDEELKKCRLIVRRRGTENREKHYTKLTKHDVDEIISGILNYKYKSYSEIRKKYKRAHGTIYNILRRFRSKNLTQDYSDEELEKCRAILSKQLSKYTIDYIKNELEKGTLPDDISKVTGVSKETIAVIKFRMKHKVKDDK